MRLRSERTGRIPSHIAPLVGREQELALLRLTAGRVERERMPQLVTIFGNAGVGKSRLLDEFCAGLDEARVVVGACVPYGDGITYLPLLDVARQLTGVLDDEPAESALAKVRHAVTDERAFVALAWTMGLDSPEEGMGVSVAGDVRRTLHEGWAAHLGAVGREQLLVLVIDDVHWASEPMLDLLDDLVGSLEDTAVLILCPSRPELLDVRPGWGTGRMRSSSLALSPLPPGEAETLLRALLGDADAPEEVVQAILGPAEGNPFFVEEMLSMLVEQGAVARHNGGWSATDALRDVQVPDSIHGVIAARIDLLQAAEREALRRCSVMGRVFWPSAVGIDDDVIAALGPRALVSEQPSSAFTGRREFAFKHVLTQDVAYSTLPRNERRELHRRVAEWIADAVPDRRAEITEVVAYHYEQALAHGDRDPDLQTRTFDALVEAVEVTVLRASYAAAGSLASRALTLAPGEEARVRALLLAAQVDVHTAQHGSAIPRLDEVIAFARLHGDRRTHADALGWKARACWLAGKWRDALESGEEAVALLEGEATSPALARALARLSQIQMLRGLPETARTAIRAIEVARASGELAAEANARINLFTVDDSLLKREELSEIIDLATRGGAHDEAVRAVVNYLWSGWLYSPLPEIEHTVAEAAKGLSGWTAEAYAQYLRLSLAVLVYLPAGHWDEADEVAAGEPEPLAASNRLVWHWLLTGLALRRGDLDRVDELLPEFRRLAIASEEPQRIVPMLSVAVPRALQTGEEAEVRALAEVTMRFPPTLAATAPSALAACRAFAAAGEVKALRALSGRFEDVRGVAGSIFATAQGLQALAEGSAATAAEALARAEQELRAFGHDYSAACVALDLARALDEAGDARAASGARGRATPLLERLGCVYPW